MGDRYSDSPDVSMVPCVVKGGVPTVVRWVQRGHNRAMILTLDGFTVIMEDRADLVYKVCFIRNYIPVDEYGSFDVGDMHCDGVPFVPFMTWRRYWKEGDDPQEENPEILL